MSKKAYYIKQVWFMKETYQLIIRYCIVLNTINQTSHLYHISLLRPGWSMEFGVYSLQLLAIGTCNICNMYFNYKYSSFNHVREILYLKVTWRGSEILVNSGVCQYRLESPIFNNCWAEYSDWRNCIVFDIDVLQRILTLHSVFVFYIEKVPRSGLDYTFLSIIKCWR